MATITEPADSAATTRRTQPKKLRKNEISLTANIVLNVVFLIAVALILIPFFLLVTVSLTDNDTLIQEGYRFIPSLWSTEAYSFLFQSPRLVRDAYMVTIIVTVVGTFGHVLLGALVGYALTKTKMPGHTFFTVFVFFTMLFNGGLVSTYIINTQFLGFRNAFRGLILPLMFNVWHVLILRTYFATAIPASIEESAKIDGANDLRIFFQIVVPLSKPVLATIGLFAALIYWNDWFQSLLYITEPRMYSLQFVMLQTLRQIEMMQRLLTMGAPGDVIDRLRDLPQESVRFAMVVVSIGPIIFAYPFFQRYFVKGVTIGALKG
ncbi:MAG: carbohydrate ABC transporter permease [Spirochaetaceae bacterium]|nr:MAG: carbohydrate ABC transporter permease [Spirochaetaceae bacterium]